MDSLLYNIFTYMSSKFMQKNAKICKSFNDQPFLGVFFYTFCQKIAHILQKIEAEITSLAIFGAAKRAPTRRVGALFLFVPKDDFFFLERRFHIDDALV